MELQSDNLDTRAGQEPALALSTPATLPQFADQIIRQVVAKLDRAARDDLDLGPGNAGFFLELSHHLLPDDDWLVAETAALAAALGLPVVTTNDVHYARPEERELHDVLTAIGHGRTLDTLGDLRRPDGESHLKSGTDLLAMPPGATAFARADPATATARRKRLRASASVR